MYSKPLMAVQSNKHPIGYSLYQQPHASACVRPAASRPFASDALQAPMGRLLWNETAILPAMKIPRYSYRLPRFWHVLIAMFYHVLTQGLTENGIYCTTNSLQNAILGYHGVPYFQTHPLDVFFWRVTWHQWPFQVPKLEVPTIYRACIRPM